MESNKKFSAATQLAKSALLISSVLCDVVKRRKKFNSSARKPLNLRKALCYLYMEFNKKIRPLLHAR